MQNIIKPASIEEAFQQSPLASIEGESIHLRKVRNKPTISDIFLKESEEVEEALYSSKMNQMEPKSEPKEKVQTFFIPHLEKPLKTEKSPFIIANTSEVAMEHLQQDCIIPVFSKDNEKTIAHQEFIEVMYNAIQKVFPHHQIDVPEIRVSHQIKGRVPSAIHKPAKELLDHEKTIYYERMAFIMRIPSITEVINGNELSLTIGGVRAYNQENLYSKKTFEKFKIFIGFQNQVCMNLCVSSDGFVEDMRVSNIHELQKYTFNTLQEYDAQTHLEQMKQLTAYHLTEHQFAQLVGKCRLYHHLPKSEKLQIPHLNFNDSHISMMAKDYYGDDNFCRKEDGKINLWDVYNLFTQANKSSYIDTFLDRNLNAFEFSKGIQEALNGSSKYHWFLS